MSAKTLVGIRAVELHQVNLVGPHHLLGTAKFHASNLIDVGSHL